MIKIFIPLFLLSFLFVSCGTKTLQDGSYRIDMEHATPKDAHGWEPFIEATVEGGQIVQASYNEQSMSFADDPNKVKGNITVIFSVFEKPDKLNALTEVLGKPIAGGYILTQDDMETILASDNEVLKGSFFGWSPESIKLLAGATVLDRAPVDKAETYPYPANAQFAVLNANNGTLIVQALSEDKPILEIAAGKLDAVASATMQTKGHSFADLDLLRNPLLENMRKGITEGTYIKK